MPPARRICGGKNLDIPESLAYNIMEYPGVAKFGIALGSGPRGRGFESRHSDHSERPYGRSEFLFYLRFVRFEHLSSSIYAITA